MLIIRRIADKSMLTSNTVVSGEIGSFEAGSRGKLVGDDDLLVRRQMRQVVKYRGCREART